MAKETYLSQGRKVQGADPLGYRWDKEGKKFAREEKEAETVRLIFTLYVDGGLSLTSLAEELRKRGIKSPRALRGYKGARPYWDPSSLQGILRNRTYTSGLHEIKSRGIAFPLTAEVLIEKPLWEAAQVLMRERRHFKVRPGGKGLFQGRIWCGRCGRKYYRTNWWVKDRGGSTPCYYCAGRSQKVVKVEGIEKCKSPILPIPDVDDLLWGNIAAAVVDKASLRQGAEAYLASLDAVIAELSPDISRLEMELQSKREEKERRVQTRNVVGGDFDDFVLNVHRLDAEIENIEQRLADHADDTDRLRRFRADAHLIRTAIDSGLTAISRIEDLGDRKVRVHLDLAAYFNEHGHPEVVKPTDDRIIEVDFSKAPPASGKGDEPGGVESWTGSFVTTKDTMLEMLRVKVTADYRALKVRGVLNLEVLFSGLGFIKVNPASGCAHVVRGETEEELLKNAEAHAREHGIVEVTPELLEQIKANIEDEVPA